MLNPEELRHIQCPYCGKHQQICVDVSQGDHDYIEDCTYCCKPIEFGVEITEQADLNLQVRVNFF